jgi:predicted P-loop ATPase
VRKSEESEKTKIKTIQLPKMISIYDKHTNTKPSKSIYIEDIHKILVSGSYATDTDLIERTAAIRAGNKELKSTLPIATFSAGFEANRAIVAKHTLTGYICVDFDKLQPQALQQLLNELKDLPYTALLFISPSGNGVKWITAVNGLTNKNFSDTAKALLQWVANKYSVEPDKQCIDYSRACYLCYDIDAYLNDNPANFLASELLQLYPPVAVISKPEKNDIIVANDADKLEQVEYILEQCKARNMSITQNYNDWFTLGAALATSFDESIAKSLFHEFSRLDTNYNANEVDYKLRDIIKNVAPNQKITFGSVIHLAKQQGITIARKAALNKIGTREMIKNKLAETYKFYMDADTYTLYRSKQNISNPLLYEKLEEKSPLLNSILMELERSNIPANKTQLWETIYNPQTYAEINLLQDTLSYIGSQWDGVDYLAKLYNCISVTDKKLFEKQFAKWAVNLIAQAYGKSRNDYALILVGQQGTGKTHFFEKLLFNDSYVTNQTGFEPSNKNHEILLNTKLLIILDEMATYSKADLNQLKSCLTKDKITVDRKFQHERDYKRNASFCGTSNNAELLKDATGDRRYLVFELTEQIDFDIYNSINKAQLWGQLITTYKDNFDYKFTGAEIKANIERNKEQFTMQTQEDFYISHCIEITKNENDIIFCDELNNDVNAYAKSITLGSRIAPSTITQKLKSMGVEYKSVYDKASKKSKRAYAGAKLMRDRQRF